jgi:hypothetical protein
VKKKLNGKYQYDAFEYLDALILKSLGFNEIYVKLKTSE